MAWVFLQAAMQGPQKGHCSLMTAFTFSVTLPSKIVPPDGLGGVKILTTWVGEPVRPRRLGSTSMSAAVQTLIDFFLAFILQRREGRRGSLISLTTVMTTGAFTLIRT